MNNDEDYLKKIASDITAAAEILARQFPTLEYEDIHQNLWVYVLDRKSPLLLAEENGTPINYLVQAGQRQCGKELAAANPRADDFYYSANSIRKLIERGGLYYIDKDVAGRSDLTVAYDSLSDREKQAIKETYLDGDSSYRVRGSAKEKALQRAIDKLAYEMNRIGESRSEWHKDRAVTGWVGSKPEDYGINEY